MAITFVEFGTGIIGEAASHPEAANVGWEYDHNHHGTDGWMWQSKLSDGEWHWTAGQPSRPFMYTTLRMLRDQVPDVAKQMFDKL